MLAAAKMPPHKAPGMPGVKNVLTRKDESRHRCLCLQCAAQHAFGRDVDAIEPATVQLPNGGFVDLAGFEVKVREVFLGREAPYLCVIGEHTQPQLAKERRLIDTFTSMIRNGEENGLAAWLDQAKASELAAFARGLSVVLDAVTAALSKPWLNGQSESQINSLKILKGQMYGAAVTELLLARLRHSE